MYKFCVAIFGGGIKKRKLKSQESNESNNNSVQTNKLAKNIGSGMNGQISRLSDAPDVNSQYDSSSNCSTKFTESGKFSSC